jgi:RNA polymerase sigma-70 factor (ECF subfamily)
MSTGISGSKQGWFATTHWSVVVSAGRGEESTTVQQALESLCRNYWQPLYSYVRRRGYSAEDAQDLTQEFFARLVQHNRIARADQQRGKFRSFLLSSMKNFLADEWDKAHAQKRGGGVQTLQLEFDTGEKLYVREPADVATPEQIYERRWALTLLDHVLTCLREEYEREGKGDLFAALSDCLLGERADQPYARLGEQLGLGESGVKSAVHRLRKRYRQLLRNEIANTVASSSEVDEELRHLLSVLAQR